jgi:tetratricopeptide (TPR) repeat protein
MTMSRTFVLAAALAAVVAGAHADAPAQPRSFETIGASADAYLHYSMGRLFETSGLLTEALVQYRNAWALDPGHCEMEVAIGRTLLLAGRLDEARAHADAALEMCPGDYEAVAVAAEARLASEDPEGAEHLLRAAGAPGSAPVALVALLAQALMSDGRADEAESMLAARVRVDSLSSRLAYLRARALIATGRAEEAVAELRRSDRLGPQNGAARSVLGRLLLALGRPAEAAPILERIALEPDPGESDFVMLARARGGLGDYDGASEAVEEGVRRFGETAALLRTRGSIDLDQGRVDASLSAYEHALELEPDSVEALNFLAYTLAEEDTELTRALEYARRAVELAPQSGLVRDTLGWVYFKLGRYEDAVREIGASLGLGEEDPVVLEHLGDALSALGRDEEAREAWRRALAWEPGRPSTLERLERESGEGKP